MDNKLFLRTLMTLVLIFFILSIIYLVPVYIYSLVVLLFITFGQIEFFRLIEKEHIVYYKKLSISLGVIMPIVVYFQNLISIKTIEMIFIVIAIFFIFTIQLYKKKKEEKHIINIAIMILSLFYVSWLMSFFIKIRFLNNGANLVTFIILVTKGSDIAAYLVGSFLGKNKLIPRISPKKTIEGTIGGVIVSLIISLTIGKILTNCSFYHLCFLGIFLSIIGQVGDLIESLIKRDCNVKDSGSYFSGIGGVLDLIDSLLFTAPSFYFYIKYIV